MAATPGSSDPIAPGPEELANTGSGRALRNGAIVLAILALAAVIAVQYINTLPANAVVPERKRELDAVEAEGAAAKGEIGEAMRRIARDPKARAQPQPAKP
jgi:hypothetical protein